MFDPDCPDCPPVDDPPIDHGPFDGIVFAGVCALSAGIAGSVIAFVFVLLFG